MYYCIKESKICLAPTIFRKAVAYTAKKVIGIPVPSRDVN
jgi:hypothetical protein